MSTLKDIKAGGDSKPRWYDKEPPKSDYEAKDCGSGGKYQELETLGKTAEFTGGTRLQRLHGRNYCKEVLARKPDLLDMLTETDTHGPPFEDSSVPRRIL